MTYATVSSILCNLAQCGVHVYQLIGTYIEVDLSLESPEEVP